jgi:carboxyl-terminal processing protease
MTHLGHDGLAVVGSTCARRRSAGTQLNRFLMNSWASIALLALSAANSPAQPSMNDARYWQATSLTLSYAQRFISNKLCYSGAKYFFSCVEAINTAGSYLDVPLRIEPAGHVQPGERVLRPYPALTLVSHAALGDVPGRSLRLRVENERRERQHLVEAGGKHFTSSGARIDFEAILKRIMGGLPPRVPPQMALGAAISAQLRTFDAHAAIRPHAQDEAQSAEETRAFVGIGITFRMFPRGAGIVDVFRNSPAHLAGLRKGDLITRIISRPGDGPVATAGEQTSAVANLIGGPEDVTVELTVQRGSKQLDVKIPRKHVDLPLVSGTIIDTGGFPVGYVRIRSFVGFGVCANVHRQLLRFEADGALGVVLDLRDNPGGLLNAAICVASQFMGRQRVVGVKYIPVTLPGHTNDFAGDARRPIRWRQGLVAQPSRLPTAILIDGGTASAAEIVSGAMQAHERAWLVGRRSYGKGSVQTTFPMDDNDTLDLTETTGRFYLPNGASNEWTGIRPDFEVPLAPGVTSPDDDFTPREDDDYPNGLPPAGPLQKELRPEERDKIKACVETANRANRIMHDISRAGAAEDFQRAYAIAVLECAARQAPHAPSP